MNFIKNMDEIKHSLIIRFQGSWSQVLSKKIFLNEKLSEEERNGIKIV